MPCHFRDGFVRHDGSACVQTYWQVKVEKRICPDNGPGDADRIGVCFFERNAATSATGYISRSDFT